MTHIILNPERKEKASETMIKFLLELKGYEVEEGKTEKGGM